MEAVRKPHSAAAEAIANEFVSARLKAVALSAYPGTLPASLDEAYQVQDAAIDIFPDEVAGWKIGKMPPDLIPVLGYKSVSGPVFRKDVRYAAPGGTVEYGQFVGGFAAAEAEYMFEIGEDAPDGKISFTTADVTALVKRMVCGVEMAGSPLATINKIGPLCVVSDFGNNNGIIVGPEIPNWRERVLTELTCETFINGKSVGTGMAANVPGGPLESLRFVAEVAAKMGRPLKAGQYITTGAITGIHDVAPGELARVEFKGLGAIQCVGVPMKPRI
jgi:2-keto-4-pentenoate hydratase